MTKKMISFTVINCCVCLSIIIWILTAKTGNIVQAYQPPLAFLGLLYYGSTTTLKVFDHQYPLFNGDGNTWTMHYDGTTCTENCGYYGYDEHTGIDYGLHYEPVLAAASGDVTRAEWATPSDHQDSYGLHVRIAPDDGPGYQLIYGHLSVLTVKMGDDVNLDPAKRDGIIGISGNTGKIYGDGSNPCPQFI